MKRKDKGGPIMGGKTIPIPASVLTKPAEKSTGGQQSGTQKDK